MEACQSFHNVSDHTNKEKMLLNHAEKIEQVRDVLTKVNKNSLKSLELVDTIQRLSLCHHFKDEIKAILHHQYLTTKSNDCDALFEASLRFRLLRQHGYEVIADDFLGHFLHREDGEMIFRGDLVGETRGVMAMHEASHLNMGGEDILREAAIFSSHYLNSKAVDEEEEEEEEEEEKMVKHCLIYPQHKSVAKFTAKNYLQFLNGENDLLQELAEFEFVNIESLHKHEILRVVEWWKELRLSNELKSSRNKPVKWHMWSMAILTNPTWSKHRILLTKPISLVYIVDDIFDLFGTIHDLTHFTQAINKWDASASDELPNYMKTCFDAIYDTTNEISNFVYQEHGWNPIHLLKKEWGSLMEAALVEAKWLRSGELAKSEEYLKNGAISCGVPLVLSHLFFLMGNPLTHQTHIILNDPQGLTHLIAKLLRLLDDLGSAQDEEQEGYDGSYLECYMKEGKVDSLEGAREHVIGMVSETWENINKHGFSSSTGSNSFSASFRLACLNAARTVPTMYTYDQYHHLPLHQHYVKLMISTPTLQ